MKSFEFVCSCCGETHYGMPGFADSTPLSYRLVPEEERAARTRLTPDECVIDDTYFFVRGCIEIPVHDYDDPFIWGVWVSQSEASFAQRNTPGAGPFFGWLNTPLSPYPDTVSLKTMAHLRDGGLRPYIQLEPTDHPLAVEQREGITTHRVAELYAQLVHGQKPEK
ncbi:MAG: DUF2199 domain-containing protein [Armatimonas sp.]